MFDSAPSTIYYLPGTEGWGAEFGGRPTALWVPCALRDDVFGFKEGPFGFNISCANGRDIIVQATTNLASGVWVPVTNATLNSSGSFYFIDPASSSLNTRFYRIAFP